MHVGQILAYNWSTAWRCPLPTTPIIIVPLPTPTLPDDDGRDKMTAANSRCYATLLEHCQNRLPKAVTYGYRKSEDSDSDGLGKMHGFGCRFRIHNNTSLFHR